MSKIQRKIDKIKSRNRKKDALIEMRSLSDNEIAARIKGKTSDNFLRSIEWRDLKRKVHEKYGYRCMCCGFTPRDKRKSNVDHIKPRKFFPELALDFDNLQVLCARCNKRKGNKDMTDYRLSTLGELWTPEIRAKLFG